MNVHKHFFSNNLIRLCAHEVIKKDCWIDIDDKNKKKFLRYFSCRDFSSLSLHAWWEYIGKVMCSTYKIEGWWWYWTICTMISSLTFGISLKCDLSCERGVFSFPTCVFFFTFIDEMRVWFNKKGWEIEGVEKKITGLFERKFKIKKCKITFRMESSSTTKKDGSNF